MLRPFTDALTKLFDQFEIIAGARPVWKDRDLGLCRSQPRHVAIHNAPACLSVKTDAGRYQRCVSWCSNQSQRPCGRGTCHAGLVQWRWPVHDANGQAMGAVTLGPYAAALGRTSAADSRRHQLASPPPTAQANALGKVLCQAISGLSHARSIELGHHAWQPQHPALIGLLELLEQQPDHQRRAPDLAAALRISASRLQHLCRDAFDLSLREVCDRQLLNHARRALLASPTRSVQQVASSLGFRDQRTFATWFKRQVGTSPSQWRSDDPV